jgi:hypothetical protein
MASLSLPITSNSSIIHAMSQEFKESKKVIAIIEV